MTGPWNSLLIKPESSGLGISTEGISVEDRAVPHTAKQAHQSNSFTLL